MNLNDSHLPNITKSHHNSIAPSSKLSTITGEKFHLPSISSMNRAGVTGSPPIAKSKHPAEGFNWLEHHPIEKNEKLPNIGHFEYNNKVENDKNISFIQVMLSFIYAS